MSDFFNFNRFQKVFNYDFKNNISNFGLSALLLACGPLFCYAIASVMSFLLAHYTWMGGPVLSARIGCFVAISICFLLMFPSKVYGFITDKRAGSSYLMIPASSFEKFISMMLNVLIIFPAFYLLVYAGLDYILCQLDPHCGNSLLYAAQQASTNLSLTTNSFLDISIFRCFLSMFEILLAFLLGAIYFKNRKISMVILIYIALCIFTSITIFTFLGNRPWEMGISDANYAYHYANAYSWLSKIFQILITIGLMTWVYFRVKTIKQ